MPRYLDHKFVDGAILSYLWTNTFAVVKDFQGIQGMCCRRRILARLRELREKHMIEVVVRPGEGTRRHHYRVTRKGKEGWEAQDLVAYWTVKTVKMGMERDLKNGNAEIAGYGVGGNAP